MVLMTPRSLSSCDGLAAPTIRYKLLKNGVSYTKLSTFSNIIARSYIKRLQKESISEWANLNI